MSTGDVDLLKALFRDWLNRDPKLDESWTFCQGVVNLKVTNGLDIEALVKQEVGSVQHPFQ